ncbi:MAG: helix-turn-helix domain-containing protein [Desulfobaccales bacterium]
MQLISVEELARRLSVPPVTVYSWARRGKIPHYKVERCIRFDETEILSWLKAKKKPALEKTPDLS